MASLNSLPTENLYQILDLLSDKRDLASVALCTQRLNALATPLLFAACTFTSALPISYVHFVRTILTSPFLASYVRKVDALEVRNPFYDPQKLIGHDHISAILDASNDIDEARDWSLDVNDGRADALLSLILPSLPNLHELAIRLPEATYWDRMISSCRPPLTHLTIEPRDPEYDADPKDVCITADRVALLLTSIPTLTHFTGVLIRALPRDDPLQLSPGSSSLVSLILCSSFITPSALKQLCQSSRRGLRHLHYEFDTLWSNESGFFTNPVVTRPREIGLAIAAAARDTLESLYLGSCKNAIAGMGTSWEPETGFGDALTSFSRLKCLDARAELLLCGAETGIPEKLVDVLPTSIEKLRLSNCEGARNIEVIDPSSYVRPKVIEEENVAELVSLKTERFPSLKRVELAYRVTYGKRCVRDGCLLKMVRARNQLPPKEGWLQEECKDSGVELVINFGRDHTYDAG